MTDGARSYVGRLEADGRRVGTAFQVLPDGMGVTAVHVLMQIGRTAQGDELELVGQADPHTARLCRVTDRIDLQHDLAVVEFQPPLLAPPLAVRTWEAALEGASVVVQGYGALEDAEHVYGFLPTAGELWGVVERDGVSLLVVNAKGVLQGMSGGPVLLQGTNQLVGVVSGRYNSADGWYRDSVWIASAADVAILVGEGIAASFVSQAEDEISRGNYDVALAKLHEAVKFQPTNVTALFTRAQVHFLQERYRLARLDLNQALMLQPDDAKALALRGIIHHSQGNRSGAKADLQAALKLAPSDAFVCNCLRLIGP